MRVRRFEVAILKIVGCGGKWRPLKITSDPVLLIYGTLIRFQPGENKDSSHKATTRMDGFYLLSRGNRCSRFKTRGMAPVFNKYDK